MPTILITGAEGFVGEHVCAAALDRGLDVVRVVKPSRQDRPCRWQGASSGGSVQTVALEEERLDEIVGARPLAAVVHLAARTFIPDCEGDPLGTLSTNVGLTMALLGALERVDPQRRTRWVFASTAQVYRGDPRQASDDGPLVETASILPPNVYANSKLAAESVCRCVCHSGERERALVILRAFNHAGPGQKPVFAVSSFARQLARIEAGQQPPVLKVGDLSVERDLTDVRDAARAYLLAALGEVPAGTYNVASGRAVALQDVVERLRRMATKSCEVRSSARIRRAHDTGRLCGAHDKLRDACGWRPEISLEETLRDTLQWWRREIREPETT